MRVTETFFSLEVRQMERATNFYVTALGATVAYASESWSSLIIAGVRVGLALNEDYEGERVGLHFAVEDLDAARKAVEQAGGTTRAPRTIGPGIRLVEATDPEGNTFVLSPSKH